MRCLSFALLVVVACGSNPTADQACTTLAQDTCNELMTCSAADMQRRWPDVATCEAREKLACTQALAAPKNANNPSHEEACASALAKDTCDAYLSGVEPPMACLPPKGTLANGAACSFAGQCMSSFCAVAPGSLCGTCANEPAVGDSCAMQGCGPTMNCVGNMTCQIPVASGGQCGRDLPCIEGQSCVGATMTAMGTCMAQGTTAGATCDARQMTGPNCSAAAGLTCDTTNNQCAMQPLVPAGQTCGVINGLLVGCLAGASCNRATGSATGTCVAPAADGAACDSANGPFCTTPAKCVTTTGTAGTCELVGSQAC
jgi:hypothetical protein